MELSVVIPTYNGHKILMETLPVVFDGLKSIKLHEIIIVDNNSQDMTKQFIEEDYPAIHYIGLERNQGFTGGVNKGVQRAQGEYILMLNNDCYLEPDTVERMFDFLKQNPEYIATQPVVYKMKNGKVKMKNREVENIGYIVDTWVGKAQVVTEKSQIPNSKFQTNSKSKDSNSRFIYGLSATCLLIRKNVFEEIGMFDESFHSYLEDIDLFIRLNKKGYQYAATLTAFCQHLHMATSSQMSRYKQQRDLKNWVRIIFKNYPSAFIFTHFSSLFAERLRNLSGLIKTYI